MAIRRGGGGEEIIIIIIITQKKRRVFFSFLSLLEWDVDLLVCKGGGGWWRSSDEFSHGQTFIADEGKPFFCVVLCARQHLTIDPRYDIIISNSLSECVLFIFLRT
jgi:hypothetical protein